MGERVARMGRGKVQAEFWRENMTEGDHLQDPGGEGGF
jgi:hypothetical protein